jgi:hypothetical protein
MVQHIQEVRGPPILEYVVGNDHITKILSSHYVKDKTLVFNIWNYESTCYNVILLVVNLSITNST